MSILGEKLKHASRAHKDVLVMLDGALFAERDRLMQAVADARHAMPDEAEETRLGENPQAALEAAVAAVKRFEEDLADAFVQVRVVELPDAEWKKIVAAHPLTDDNRNIPENKMNGFDVAAAAQDAVEASGGVVNGDELERPSADEWSGFWENINRGDMWSIARAVLALNEGDRARGGMYGRAKKA